MSYEEDAIIDFYLMEKKAEDGETVPGSRTHRVAATTQTLMKPAPDSVL